MDLTEYRESDAERARTEDLARLIALASNDSGVALDIGARDGHFSILLMDYFHGVTALDLEKPSIDHDKVSCVKGDITNLEFEDNSFDLVFCAEVLEHIPPHLLRQASTELSRVCRGFLLIGVPYKQDIRVSRSTCFHCGGKNPPWGHVNSFDRKKLRSLFQSLEICEESFVGETRSRTNFVSTFLMDLAGNPYGTYGQEEACIHCDRSLESPPGRTLLQKVFTKASVQLQNAQSLFVSPRANWIHILLRTK